MRFLKEMIDHDFVRSVIKRFGLHPVPLPECELLPDFRVTNDLGQFLRERYPWGEIVFATDHCGREYTGIAVGEVMEAPEWVRAIVRAGKDKEEIMALSRPDCLGCYARSVICDGGWDARSHRDQKPCSVLAVCKAVRELAALYRMPPEELAPSLTDEELTNLGRTQKGGELELDRYAEVRPFIERFASDLGSRLNLDVWTDRHSAQPGDLFLREGFQSQGYQITICRVRTDDSAKWNPVVRLVPRIKYRTLTLYINAQYDVASLTWPSDVSIKYNKYDGWEIKGVTVRNYRIAVENIVTLVRKRFIECYNVSEVLRG